MYSRVISSANGVTYFGLINPLAVQRCSLTRPECTFMYLYVRFPDKVPKNLDNMRKQLSRISKDFVSSSRNRQKLEFSLESQEEGLMNLTSRTSFHMFDDIGAFDHFVTESFYGSKAASRIWGEISVFYFDHASDFPNIWTAWSTKDNLKYVTVKDHKDVPFNFPANELERLASINWLRKHLLFN